MHEKVKERKKKARGMGLNDKKIVVKRK